MLRSHLFAFLAIIGISVGVMGMTLSSYFYYQDSKDNSHYHQTTCYIIYTTAPLCAVPCSPCNCLITTEFATQWGNFTFRETCQQQSCIEKYSLDALPCWTIDNLAVTLTDPLVNTDNDLYFLVLFISIFFIGLGMLVLRYCNQRYSPAEEERPLIR